MSERRLKSANKLDQFEWNDEVVDSMPDTPPLPRTFTVTRPEEAVGGDVMMRLETMQSELVAMRKRQDAMEQKYGDSETIRRGQLDCLSERVYEAEKTQRQVQERTDDAIEKARAAFQKTASDMEHERINLMSVITQVNQNFEHLSREMAQLSDHVTRTQQDLIHLQQEVAERCVDDATGFAHQLAHLEEHHSGHLREIRESQHSLSQQLMDVQCQLVPVLEQDRSIAHFRKEVGTYLEQLTHMAHDSEAQCRNLSEQLLQIRKEVTRKIADEIKRHVKDLLPDVQASNEMDQVDTTGYGPQVTSVRDSRGSQSSAKATDDTKGWLDGEHRPPPTMDERSKQSRGAFPQAKDVEDGQDYRLLEFLLAQDDFAQGPRRREESLRWPSGEKLRSSLLGYQSH